MENNSMENDSRKDIRALLKTFGVRADEAIIQHLAKHPDVRQLQLKLILQDQTDYGASAPADPLHLEIDGNVSRRT